MMLSDVCMSDVCPSRTSGLSREQSNGMYVHVHCFEYSVKITENFLHPVTQKISVKFTEPVNLIITEVFCKIVYFYFSVISVPLFKYCLVFVSGVARIWRYGGTGGLGQARRLPSPLSSPPLPSPPLPLPSP